MNDWKRILENLPDDSAEKRKFQTTEINLKALKTKHILGVSPALFWVCVSVVSLVLILGGFWLYVAVNEVNAYDRIYPGVTALEIDLGGMTKDEALAAVNEYSNNYYSGKQIVLTCRDEAVVITARDAITAVDAQSVADAAYAFGRDKGFLSKYRLIKSSEKHVLEIKTNATRNDKYIETKVDELIASVTQEYKYYDVQTQSGWIKITRGQDGVSVRREELINEVKAMLSANDFREFSVQPDVQKAEVPNAEALRAMIYVAPKDAALVKTGSKTYKVEKEVVGVDVDAIAIQADFESDDWVEKTYQFTYIQPLTEAEFKALLFRDVLAEYTTTVPLSDENRTTNIRLAAAAANGVVLNPAYGETAGDVFSFNGIVGERTEARGYKPASVFAGGGVEIGIGGGICQVSSTIYSATLYAGLEVTERHPHDFVVSYITGAMDATISYGYLDYKFQNTSAYPVKLEVKLTGDQLTVKIYGTKTTDTKIELRSDKITDTRYELHQVFYEGDKIVESRLVNTSVYKTR